MTFQDFSKFSEILSQVAKRKKSPCPDQRDEKKARLMEEEEKRFSNDMAECCTHQCRLCHRLVSLTGLRSHTRTSHHITIKDYVEQFGNYREQIHTETWHQCGLCNKEILLDGDSIHKHCNSHKITMAEYSNLYLVVNNTNKPSASKHSGSAFPVKLEVLKEKVTGVISTIEAIENILDSL